VLEREREKGVRVIEIDGAKHADKVADELATIIDELPR
jgi:hypothetical protein